MALGQKYVFLDYSMIEELYGIEKVEEILMHHSYVGVNLEQICPLIVHAHHHQYLQPASPPISETFISTTEAPRPPVTQIIPIMNELDQQIIDVLIVTDLPTDTVESTTTEKATTKKKDKKEGKEGMKFKDKLCTGVYLK